MKRRISLLVLFTCTVAIAAAQDSIASPKKLAIAGYVKNIESLSFDKHFDELVSGNLIHNRINIKWKPGAGLQAVAEFRNRLFWGEQVRITPGFFTLLKNPSERMDLQKTWINKKALVFHTNTERLYLDYRQQRWNLRAGRQRINWSITTSWNPNDIFNTYNFLDFDYEERPGVDGVKLQYMFDGNSNMEIAYATTLHGSVGAIKYAFNKWKYDFQFLSGWYNKQTTIGIGWAGSIKEAGFKGEAQYFFGNHDTQGHLNLAAESDYVFSKGWYLNAGFLFNSKGMNNSIKDWSQVDLRLSPSNLMPTKWTLRTTASKEFTPLLSATLSVLYGPDVNLLVVLPSMTYNMLPNLDLDLVWQSFFSELNRKFSAVDHRAFLRLKFSF
jgi:hypothetical protein